MVHRHCAVTVTVDSFVLLVRSGAARTRPNLIISKQNQSIAAFALHQATWKKAYSFGRSCATQYFRRIARRAMSSLMFVRRWRARPELMCNVDRVKLWPRIDRQIWTNKSANSDHGDRISFLVRNVAKTFIKCPPSFLVQSILVGSVTLYKMC
jgi:hypothetical protein